MKKVIVISFLFSEILSMERTPLLPLDALLHEAIKIGNSHQVEELIAPFLNNFENPHPNSLRPLLHQPIDINFEAHYNHAKTLTQKKAVELRSSCSWHFLKHITIASFLIGATALNSYYYFLTQESDNSNNKTDKLLQILSVGTGAGISLGHAWHSLNNIPAQLSYEKQKQIQLLLKQALDKQKGAV